MSRNYSPSPNTKRYSWESDRSRSQSRGGRVTQGRQREARRSPSEDRRKRCSSYSPPVRRIADRRSESRQNRRRDRSRSRRCSRSRSRSRGKGKGKNNGRACVDFIAKRCQRGDGCAFRHPDEEERRKLEDILKSQPCRMGAKCTRPHCVYMHPDDDLRRRNRSRRRGRSSSSELSRSRERPKVPMMKAVGLKTYGDMTLLEDVQLPKPKLDTKGKDVLVRIRGSDVNSFKVSEGAIVKEGSSCTYRVIGCSFAGIVEEMCDEAFINGKFKVGDAVWFPNTWEPACGWFQEYYLVDHRAVSLKPRRLASFADAAAIPSVALNAWGAMVEQMSMDCSLFLTGMRPPRFTEENKGVFLAFPGSCASGSFALQLASRYLNKNNTLIVIACASGQESTEWCKKMGAHHVIDQQAFSFREELDKIGIKGLDFVFYGMPPSQYEEKLYSVMNPMGQIASYHEGTFEKMDVCYSKWISIHRESIEARKMLPEFRKVNGEVLETVARLFDDESVRLESIVTKRFPELTAETVRQADGWQAMRSIDWANAMGHAVFEMK